MESSPFHVSPSFVGQDALYSDYLGLRYPKTARTQYTQSICVVFFVYFSCINGVYFVHSSLAALATQHTRVYFSCIFRVYLVHYRCVCVSTRKHWVVFFVYFWRIFGVYLVRVCLVIYMVLFDLAYRERKQNAVNLLGIVR